MTTVERKPTSRRPAAPDEPVVEAPPERPAQPRLSAAALGLIETVGLAAGIEAADAMVKSANVTIVARQQVGGGLVAILVRGDTGSVKAAVDAGATAAAKVGKVVSSHVIPRPHDGVEAILRRRFVK